MPSASASASVSEPVAAGPAPATGPRAYSAECTKALARVLDRRCSTLDDCQPKLVNPACVKDAIVIQCITVRVAPNGASIAECTVNDGGDRP